VKFGDGNMPKISIITPVYADVSQKVDWLDEMIQSVQAQTEQDWELIIIDDKSEIPIDYIRVKHNADIRLRWFENSQNFGPAKTRNTAVALADSECILPLDSDDLLANPDTLERLYEEWDLDHTKIIYGNLQTYTPIVGSGKFERGKVIELGQYTFELAMNLNGLMPITAMHSKNCHFNTIVEMSPEIFANGWKPELVEGLEDVEYWIAAGEHGYCGMKINHTTLVYRRQEKSRAYELKHVNQMFEEMQRKIKEMHNNVYQGRIPMACCGKGVSTPVIDPVVMSMQSQTGNQKITELSGYDENQLEWVLYDGGRMGSFSVLVPSKNENLPSSYMIKGKGHIFQIHKSQHVHFEKFQKVGYKMNQLDPRIKKDVEKQKPAQVEVVKLNEPDAVVPNMSTIVRIDSIAARTLTPDIQSMPVAETSLLDLELSKSILHMLESDKWTIEKLSDTTSDRLAEYKGVGLVRARAIINKAQDLLKVFSD